MYWLLTRLFMQPDVRNEAFRASWDAVNTSAAIHATIPAPTTSTLSRRTLSARSFRSTKCGKRASPRSAPDRPALANLPLTFQFHEERGESVAEPFDA
jgi:hypothetical protein